MSENNETSVMGGILKRAYSTVFYENWPIWLGGILIGIMSVITFAWARPFGVVGGLRNWADWFFNLIGVYSHAPLSPLISTNSILTLGLLWGAFGAALMSKQFAIRMAPGRELIKGIVGGSLLGIGSAMAGGCNVGGFYIATSALSFSGLAMMVGLIVGAYLGLRYLYWEMMNLPHKPPKAGTGKKGPNLLVTEPYIGAAVFLAAIVAALIYVSEAYARVGGLLLCGITFGVIIQRTRFCFVRCFRDPFMTGEGDMVRAVTYSIIISILGFAALKWTGLRGEEVYVTQTFWFGSLVGGIIFGFGMLIAGGCGTGSVWRAGEGHIKLMVVVACFALTNSLFKALIKSSEGFKALIGNRVFLPDFLTYKWTIVILVAIFAAYALIATWNEETDKFTVEM
ncbi:MAG: YeeE/YedE family protein [Deltaproteobacteria bacterium]|nr:YeeE/YedE family protein [Deltaproteobacteria bacterium]MBW2342750.1 YeeE/YedE family protein [Deltaproteobacteria bacterium]